MVHNEVIGTPLFDNLPCKGEGVGGGEQNVGAANPGSGAAHHVIERSAVGVNIIGAVGSFDVLIMWAAIEDEVTFGGDLTGVRVVSDSVRANNEGAKIDFYASHQVVNVTNFFLLIGFNGHFLNLRRDRQPWQLAGN